MARNAQRKANARQEPIPWKLSLGDFYIAAVIFAATLIYNVKSTPRRQNPLATPLVDMLATSIFAVTIYLAVRVLPTPARLARGLMIAHAAIWFGASGVHLLLTPGDVHFLPLLVPMDYPFVLLFGWIFFLPDNARPGLETDRLMLIAHLCFIICSTLGWGLVGYAIGMFKARCGRSPASTRGDDVERERQ